MNICLSDMQVGDQGRVTGIRRGEKAYQQKLLAMGLTPGTTFSVTRYAPLGDPVEIQVRGFALSLRQGEANTLLVERIEK
jgi:ferrous iron transport protein A